MKKIGKIVLPFLLLLCLCGCGKSENATSAAPAATQPTAKTVTESGEKPSVAASSTTQQKTEAKPTVSPAFKATMDSYEAFFDEYVSIVKQYMSNPLDTAVLSKYTEYVGRYTDMLSEMTGLNNGSLSAADLEYYLEVNGRIMDKLATVF